MQKTFTNSIGMNMISVESGEFFMGSTTPPAKWDEQPIHKVKISNPFYISEKEVTVEQFQQFRTDFTGTEEYIPYQSEIERSKK